MNIALPTIIISLIVLPGIILRYAYRRGPWRSPIVFDSFTNELLFGIVFSIIVHVLAAMLLGFAGYEYDFRTILAFLSGYWTQNSFNDSILVLETRFFAIALYFALTCILAFFSGNIAHRLIRRMALDLKISFFRFKNDWYYLLSGEKSIIDKLESFPLRRRLFMRQKNIESILESMYCFVSVVITHNGQSYLYWGILSDFFFGKDGSFERLVLRETSRRPLAKDSCEDEPHPHSPDNERFYPIQGHYIVIDYAKINTLNVEYRYLTEEAEIKELK